MSANDDLRHPFLTPLKPLSVIPYWQKPPISASAWGGNCWPQPWGNRCPAAMGRVGNARGNHDARRGNRSAFADAGSSFITFQWHHDSFDLPDGTRLLATSAACPNQAFRVGNAGWGLQFHPEVNEKIIRDWCAWDAETAARAEELVADFRKQQPAYAATARKLLLNFIRHTGITA